ncbi:MAG: glycerol-3-phosphate acyltransferase [Acidimicrobiia bacterium]
MIWSILLGYAIGSIPSADIIARGRGHDLRNSGTGNPGTANALRVAGRSTAAVVLAIDVTKGAVAVMAGAGLANTGGCMAAGLAAIAGQVLNPWFGFRGGRGLGVAAGVTAIAWPPGLLAVLPITALGARFLRAAGGAILGLTAYSVGAVLWAANDWPTWWGLPSDDLLVWLAIGVVALTAPKFVSDLKGRSFPKSG